jgi:8-oxo-dGTP diphosphatase
MLNRNNSPNMGLWNGVGGHIEVDENPINCILREIYEETRLKVDAEHLSYHGVVRWSHMSHKEGMHVFTSYVSDSIYYPTPKCLEEGILEWKSIDWILNPRNRGIVSNIFYYLPIVLSDNSSYIHSFIYTNEQIIRYCRKPF